MICHLCDFDIACFVMISAIPLLVLVVFVSVSSGAPTSAQNQTRIVGGTASSPGKWPFFAGLFSKLNTNIGENVPYCGAVIWDKDIVITAAHCIEPYIVPFVTDNFYVYVGHNDWTGEMDEAYLFKAKEVITHEDFHMGSYSNDIALIRLERSIDFSALNGVQCVCDPEPIDLVDQFSCVTMGWGVDNSGRKPSTLMEVVLPLLANEECRWASDDFDPNSHICAGDPTCGAGTCHGDSGGPLVCKVMSDPSTYSLVGITSFGNSPPTCGDCVPSFFTNVLLYLEWIGQMTSRVEITVWQRFKKRWRKFWNGPIVDMLPRN